MVTLILTGDQVAVLVDALIVLNPDTEIACEWRDELLDLLAPATNDEYFVKGA